MEQVYHEMKGDRDGKSAKRVQQETAYSAVVVNDHMYPRPYISFLTQKGHRNMKNDIGGDGDTYYIMIIHYNCTIGSFLLHTFLLIYPPSFHEMT